VKESPVDAGEFAAHFLIFIYVLLLARLKSE
jgi:hypothetical protein